jgi:transposase-like protein
MRRTPRALRRPRGFDTRVGEDEHVRAFRESPGGRHPYLWLGTKVERVREAGGVRHRCVVIAYGVLESGRHGVIGLDGAEVETEAF